MTPFCGTKRPSEGEHTSLPPELRHCRGRARRGGGKGLTPSHRAVGPVRAWPCRGSRPPPRRCRRPAPPPLPRPRSARPARWWRGATRAWWRRRTGGTWRCPRASWAASAPASARSWTRSSCATRRGAAAGTQRGRGSGSAWRLTGPPPPCPSSLQGVPVAYDNIKVVGELGDIYDDQGFIHLDVEADFIIFSPKKGKKLVVCERIGVSWVGLFFISG